MKEVVSREVAEKEVQKWLDFKKVNDKKKETYKDNIETLVDAVCEGVLALNDDMTFLHKLKFPFGEDVQTSELEYRPRLKVFEVQKCLQGVKSTEVQSLIAGYVSGLTGKAAGLIKNMDTEDNTIATAIAIFFL